MIDFYISCEESIVGPKHAWTYQPLAANLQSTATPILLTSQKNTSVKTACNVTAGGSSVYKGSPITYYEVNCAL